MFGFNKKSNLIRDLLKKRLQIRGEISPENLNFVNSLGRLQLQSLPEAIIVSVVHSVEKGDIQGVSVCDVLTRLEKVRGAFRSDPELFQKICMNCHFNPFDAMIDYINYRIRIECNAYGTLSNKEIKDLVFYSKPIIAQW